MANRLPSLVHTALFGLRIGATLRVIASVTRIQTDPPIGVARIALHQNATTILLARAVLVLLAPITHGDMPNGFLPRSPMLSTARRGKHAPRVTGSAIATAAGRHDKGCKR